MAIYAMASCCTFLFCGAFLFADGASANEKNIFILSGQSNMVGRGRLEELIPERLPSPQILRFAANGMWEVAADPLHFDIDTAPGMYPGVGPGMPFAKALVKNESSIGVIGLVPCAIRGTAIAQWAKGTPLYNTMVARAEAALKTGGGVIRGLLWYQGEADQGPTAVLYKARLQQLFHDVRSDLQLPSLPIIEVALDYVVDPPGNGTALVRKAQLDTALELHNVRCVDAKGLKTVDDVHLTTASQVKLGTMMADAFLQLQRGYDQPISPSPAP